MFKKRIGLTALLMAVIAVLPALNAGAERRVPTIDDLLSLKSVGGARISPGGTMVVFAISETDFKRDATVPHPWLADAAPGDPKIYALTSPMTYVKNAKTPTLIQHGELDLTAPPK